MLELDRYAQKSAFDCDENEMPGYGKRVLYIKSGMGLGGATLSDIAHLSLLQDMGAAVTILTGFASPQIRQQLFSRKLPFLVDPALDIYNSYNKHAMIASVDTLARSNDVVLFSLSLHSDEFFDTAVETSNTHRTALRTHENVEGYAARPQIETATCALPITDIVAQEMRKINAQMRIFTLPPYIDYAAFSSVPESHRAEIRHRHGISTDDFVLFQPTRVDVNKGIPRAVLLAKRLEEALKDSGKNVYLIVAGGAEPQEQTHKQDIDTYAASLDFRNLIYLQGVYQNAKYTVASYMKAADVITYLSKGETYGMPLAEVAVAGVPCITTPFTDNYGKPVFHTNYSGYSFLLEQNPLEDTISDATVDELVRLSTNPTYLDTLVTHNKQLAQQYSNTHIREILSKALFSSRS